MNCLQVVTIKKKTKLAFYWLSFINFINIRDFPNLIILRRVTPTKSSRFSMMWRKTKHHLARIGRNIKFFMNFWYAVCWLHCKKRGGYSPLLTYTPPAFLLSHQWYAVGKAHHECGGTGVSEYKREKKKHPFRGSNPVHSSHIPCIYRAIAVILNTYETKISLI